MSLDRRLVDSIKANFARRSTSRLREIAGAVAGGPWSPEALVAAKEVLADRLAGRVQEPANPIEDDAPPEATYDPDAFAVNLLLGLAAGLVGVGGPIDFPSIDLPRASDLPIAFGHSIAWFSVASTDTPAISAALRLRAAREATWADGMEAAHAGSVYITPPVGDWTLVLGTPLFPSPDPATNAIRPLLERLGRQFEEVQYFCTHPDLGLVAWARARRGEPLRGYCWFGARNLTLWDEGSPTDEENGLGFHLVAGQPPQLDDGNGQLVPFPDDAVHQLAHHWSIDPTTISREFKVPGAGVLGHLPTGGP